MKGEGSITERHSLVGDLMYNQIVAKSGKSGDLRLPFCFREGVVVPWQLSFCDLRFAFGVKCPCVLVQAPRGAKKAGRA